MDKLVQAIAPAPDDTVVEIGPGRGALTRALAPHVRRIIAVELDRDLAALLAAAVPANVHVVADDFLRVDLDHVTRGERLPLRVVGNLPYNISSPIVFRLLDVAEEGRRLRDATLMLQHEVAERLVAEPGGSLYGGLALQVGLVADVTRRLALPPGAFRPAPQVRSAVVRLLFRPPAAAVDRAVYERIVRGLFRHRRKTLLNALRPLSLSLGHPAEQLIERAQLSPSQRPQTLTVADAIRLSRAVL